MAQQFYKHPSASRNFCIDFTKQLATAANTPETLSGSPTITADSGITIASAAVNSSIVVPPNGEASVPASQGVTFQCSGGTDGTAYLLTASCGTSSGNTLTVTTYVNVGVNY